MNKTKFSIPTNYAITPMNGNFGIVRKDKNGPKWTWEPVYDILQVAKSYGRIVVLYHATMSQNNFMTLATYDKKSIINIPIYDALFGEEFIWVKTDVPNKPIQAWVLLNEEFKPVKSIPEFNFVIRNKEHPMHIAVGQTKLGISDSEGKFKYLELTTGKLIEPDVAKPKSTEPEPVKLPSKYNIRINTDKSYVELLDTSTGAVLDHSNTIGEIEQYAPLFEKILGKLEDVDCKQAQALLKYTRAFEPFSHGIVLGVLNEYVGEKGAVDGWKSTFSAMVDELLSGWETAEDGRQYKVYAYGEILVVLSRKPNEKIAVCTKLLHSDDESDEVILEALSHCKGQNGESGAIFHISEVEVIQQLSEKQLQPLPAPYCITQKKQLSKDIVKHEYSKGTIINLRGEFKGTTGNAADCSLVLIVCSGFKYKSKQKVGGKLADWIITNTDSIMMP